MSQPVSIQDKWKYNHTTKLENNWVTTADLNNLTRLENTHRGFFDTKLRFTNMEYDKVKSMKTIKTSVDDILFGLPNDTPIVGTNYYKIIGKCKYNPTFEETEEEDGSYYMKKTVSNKPPTNKWAYIRTKPTGKTLYKLGIGSKNSNDKGLLFSMVEDILDLNPFKLASFALRTPTDLHPGKFDGCVTVKKITDAGVKYYDENLTQVNPGNDNYPDPNVDTIEMFRNNILEHNKSYLIMIKLSFIIIILFILYKLQ